MRPRYTVIYERAALKAIHSFTPVISKRLGVKLEFFLSQPNPLDYARELTKAADAQYRFRIGDYRVLFDVVDTKIIIINVHHRRDAYRKKK